MADKPGGSDSPLGLLGLHPGDERIYRHVLRASGSNRLELTEATGLTLAELDDVLARWAIVLDDPDVAVMVAEEDGELVAFAAYDTSSLRHLAVRPDRWGNGLASTAVETVLHALDLRGCTVASLWCLEENHRARRLYEWLGWRPTRDRREAPWPPHPVEMRYTRLIPQSEAGINPQWRDAQVGLSTVDDDRGTGLGARTDVGGDPVAVLGRDEGPHVGPGLGAVAGQVVGDREMRQALVQRLKEKASGQDFDFVIKQRGMFSFSGLKPEHVEALKKKYAIYIVGSGRINVAGITPENCERLCEAIAAVSQK